MHVDVSARHRVFDRYRGTSPGGVAIPLRHPPRASHLAGPDQTGWCGQAGVSSGAHHGVLGVDLDRTAAAAAGDEAEGANSDSGRRRECHAVPRH
jgi:hypothetical protein